MRALQYDIKLIIALHDRYSLGCWSSDAYVTKYNLPVSPDCGSEVNQPDAFYSNTSAIGDYDNRILHILQHQNVHFDNRPWSDLSEVIYAFDIENESQGWMNNRNEEWLCGRAETVQSMLLGFSQQSSDGRILVGTGGGVELEDSLDVSYFECEAVDIVSLHSYEDISQFPSAIQQGMF